MFRWWRDALGLLHSGGARGSLSKCGFRCGVRVSADRIFVGAVGGSDFLAAPFSVQTGSRSGGHGRFLYCLCLRRFNIGRWHRLFHDKWGDVANPRNVEFAIKRHQNFLFRY